MTRKTNITKEEYKLFNAITSGEYKNFVLVSCFLNGEPTVAIASVTRDGEDYNIQPLYVRVSDDMVITDHDGVKTEV
jgi:hypothetical protein